ncbi:MAG: hypothetical protein R6X34_12110 [Chloroflexota bacterium]|jgi:uncharacterized small protein (DUF1192 family)
MFVQRFSVVPFVEYVAPSGLEDVVRDQAGVSREIAEASVKVVCVLREYEARLAALQEEIKSLESQLMCSGSLENRPSGNVLAIHSTRCPCAFPGHDGEVKNGRGIRRYVRKDDEEKVKEAQARYRLHEQLLHEVKTLELSYQGLLRRLHEVAQLADCVVLKN